MLITINGENSDGHCIILLSKLDIVILQMRQLLHLREMVYVSWFLGLLELGSLVSVLCPCKCHFHATQTQQVALFFPFYIFFCALTFDYLIFRRSLAILDMCSSWQAYLAYLNTLSYLCLSYFKKTF